MTHKTKGIVLRSIRYGETSLVVTIFTRLFGVQTYLINGVRTQKKAGSRASMFQPPALLELDVYHNALKGMQRIKESNWSFLYLHVLSSVIKNSIAMYMVELLYKTLKQPEAQPELFDFCEDAFLALDDADNTVAANFALYFTLQLPQFFGFRIHNNYSDVNSFLDLQDGNFLPRPPAHQHYLDDVSAQLTSEILNVMQPAELHELRLNKDIRRKLLMKYEEYYRLHLPDFGVLRSLDILHEVLK